MIYDVMSDWILFTFLECLIFSVFIVNDKRYIKQFIYVINVSILSSFQYYFTKTIPLLNQIVVYIIFVFVTRLFYRRMSFKSILLKFIIIFGMCFVLETLYCFFIMEILNINFIQLNLCGKFIYLILIRLLEVVLCLFLKGGWGDLVEDYVGNY